MKNRRIPNYPDDLDYNTNAPSYYDDLARKSKLIELLSKRIWDYDEELAKRFEAWDKNLEDFPDDVKQLLRDWIDDGTFASIINEEIFSWKADQVDLDITNAEVSKTNEDLEGRGVNLLKYGLVSDGETDQTDFLINLFETTLLNNRGKYIIPFNTKFDVKQVYPKIPIGIVVSDDSQINFANSPTYKNKFINIVTSDRTNDDSGMAIISGHHPTLHINNLGTATEADGVTPTLSSELRRTSIMFGGGIKDNKDMLLGNIFQHYVNDGKWVFGYRNYTKFSDPNTPTDATIWQMNEDGHLCVGSGADPSAKLKVVEKNAPILNVLLSNEAKGSDIYLRFRNKNDAGTTQNTYLRYDKNGLFTLRNSTNNTMFSIDQKSEFKANGGVNGNTFTTADRPIASEGTMIFDSTLVKPIWNRGGNVWVDAMGNTV